MCAGDLRDLDWHRYYKLGLRRLATKLLPSNELPGSYLASGVVRSLRIRESEIARQRSPRPWLRCRIFRFITLMRPLMATLRSQWTSATDVRGEADRRRRRDSRTAWRRGRPTSSYGTRLLLRRRLGRLGQCDPSAIAAMRVVVAFPPGCHSSGNQQVAGASS